MSDLVLRPSRDDDLDAILDLDHRAHRALSADEPTLTAARLREMRAAPGRDPGLDTQVVERDGRIVGYGALFAQSPYSEAYVMTVADPDLDDADFHRVHELLVGLGELRARVRIDPLPRDPGRVLAVSSEHDDARLAAVYSALGFVVDRHGLVMAIDLEGRDLPAPVWPDGVEAHPVRVPDDLDALSAVLTEAFLDHQGDLPFTPEFVRWVFDGDSTSGPMSVLASDAEGPVGAVVCRDRPRFGYVWVLGVLRRGRRQGLAAALLAHAFAAYADAGVTEVRLDVEESSRTGATRVYERAGMSVHSVHDTWTRPLYRA